MHTWGGVSPLRSDTLPQAFEFRRLAALLSGPTEPHSNEHARRFPEATFNFKRQHPFARTEVQVVKNSALLVHVEGDSDNSLPGRALNETVPPAQVPWRQTPLIHPEHPHVDLWAISVNLLPRHKSN
jgi:hypothetical protein